MLNRRRLSFVYVAAAMTATLALVPVGARVQGGARYAIRGVKIVTGTGATIDSGTILMRNGVIEDVGAGVLTAPDDIVVSGAGLTAYPGLIDMTNTTVVETPAPPAAPQAQANAGGGRGGGRGGAPASDETLEDQERAKRASILKPDFEAARYVRFEGAEMQRLAAAGITSVLAVPSAGLLRGQSALVNVLAPPENPQISNVGDYRRGSVVVKSPVAQHVAFAGGRGGGGGYPGSLLGVLAFIRQSFYDAQYQKDARAFSDKHKDAPRPAIEPALDALAAALDGKMPVSFEASNEREILRALSLAKEFKLDPIITGASEAGEIVDDLKAAKARVIFAVNTQGGRGGGGGRAGGGGGGRGGSTVTASVAPVAVPAALEKAGIPFAFTSEGTQAPADFVRAAARLVRDGGLSADAALKALTSNAAKMAGAGDRLGTIEKGRIANVILTDGDLFADATKVRHVFIDGRPVDIDAAPMPAAPATGRRGGGGR